jgi:hypothetical protein
LPFNIVSEQSLVSYFRDAAKTGKEKKTFETSINPSDTRFVGMIIARHIGAKHVNGVTALLFGRIFYL